MLNREVDFVLLNKGRCQRPWACLRSAMNRLLHCSNLHFYSITSSTRASTEGGTVRPRALAVLRFTTNSNLVGRSTGRSAGFAPLKILSMKTAAPPYRD